jgi:hypothetical protein
VAEAFAPFGPAACMIEHLAEPAKGHALSFHARHSGRESPDPACSWGMLASAARHQFPHVPRLVEIAVTGPRRGKPAASYPRQTTDRSTPNNRATCGVVIARSPGYGGGNVGKYRICRLPRSFFLARSACFSGREDFSGTEDRHGGGIVAGVTTAAPILTGRTSRASRGIEDRPGLYDLPRQGRA